MTYLESVPAAPQEAPDPPADLGDSGRALWDELLSSFEFDAQDVALVLEACRVKDRLEALDAVVRADGVTVESPQGVKAHPALVEARQQEITLTRIIASLRLPDEDGSRAQRRGSARGAYLSRRPYGRFAVGR
jgi:hypothetical protein